MDYASHLDVFMYTSFELYGLMNTSAFKMVVHPNEKFMRKKIDGRFMDPKIIIMAILQNQKEGDYRRLRGFD